MAEFGRTARLDGYGGRNHWGSVFSVVLAGGGVRGGQVYGASDGIGAYPVEGRVRPEDLSATIFHCLGHAPVTEYRDPLGRPHPMSRGDVLHAILVSNHSSQPVRHPGSDTPSPFASNTRAGC